MTKGNMNNRKKYIELFDIITNYAIENDMKPSETACFLTTSATHLMVHIKLTEKAFEELIEFMREDFKIHSKERKK
jgi:hypothetical protein